MRRGFRLVATLLCACSGSDRAAQAPPLPAAHAPTSSSAAPLGAAAESRKSEAAASPAGRAGLRFRGVGGADLVTESVDGVGQRIAVGDAPCVFDLEDGTRVTASPGAQVWAFARAKSLLLVSGDLQATRVVDGQRVGSPPVRIASLAGVVEPNPGAELTLRVEVRAAPLAYRAQLTLSRGSATWIAPEEHAAVKEAQLIAGEPTPMPAPGLQLLGLPAGEKTQRDKRFAALRHAPLTADLDALLDAALTEQEALRQRGQALLAHVSPRHAARVEPTERLEPSSSPRAYQRELVAHAQRREAQAKQLRSAAERSLLRALATCAPSELPTCPSLRAWSERFDARLASLL